MIGFSGNAACHWATPMSDQQKPLKRLIDLLTGIVALARPDAYCAFNLVKGKGYSAKREPVTDQVVERHVSNDQPIAIYLFVGSETCLAALDIDVHGDEMAWEDVAAKIRPLIDVLHGRGSVGFALKVRQSRGLLDG